MKNWRNVTLLTVMVAGLAQAQSQEEDLISSSAREYLERNGQIVNAWEVNEDLIAIVLETTQGEGMTVFADKAGEYLLSGAMIELESGKNIAEIETRRHFPGPSPERAYAAAEQVSWLKTGRAEEGRDPIYVVVDMQCGYCHKLAKAVAKYGVTREIRWIIVGYLGPQSRRLGGAILEMKAAPAARTMMALLTGEATGMPENVDPAGIQALDRNEAWAKEWGVQGTPYLLVPHEGSVNEVIGLPREELWEIIR